MSRWFLRLTHRTLEIQRDPGADWIGSGRSSPVFPFDTNSSPFVPRKGETWFIGFLWPKRAFEAIQTLDADVGNKRFETHKGRSLLWFSHGLATVLTIAATPQLFEECCELLSGEDNLAASEQWMVEPGKDVEVLVVNLPDYVEAADDECLFPPPINGGIAAQRLYDDLIPAAKRLIRQASTFAPSASSAYRAICERLSVPCETLATPGKTQAEYVRAFGELAEMHHTFAAVLLQGFTGTPPLLEHPGPPIGHSLLGVGRSLQGIQAIERHFTQAFTAYPVDSLLDDLADSPAFELQHGARDGEAVHFASSWPVIPASARVDGSTILHLPVYLSMRRAFRETPNSLTVPTLALSLGSQSDWHVITITHELLHAYVRSLIGSLFTVDGKSQDETVKKLALRLFSRNSQCSSGLDSFRLAVLACTARLYQIDLDIASASSPSTIEYRRTISAAAILDAFDKYSEELQELFVHKLDFHYTYQANPSLYLASAWKTWTTVPVADERIATYIVRSLLAITPEMGKKPSKDERVNGKVPHNRYKGALSTYREVFRTQLRVSSHPLIKKAQAVLDELAKGVDTYAIKSRYIRSLYVADIAQHFLAKGPADGRLNHTLAQITRDQVGKLDADHVANPLSILRSVFVAKIPAEKVDRLSAWQLLLLSDYGGISS